MSLASSDFRSTSNGGWARTSLATGCFAQCSFSAFSSRALSAAIDDILRVDAWRDASWPRVRCGLCCCESDRLNNRTRENIIFSKNYSKLHQANISLNASTTW